MNIFEYDFIISVTEAPADSVWMIVPECDLSVCPKVKELNN